MKKNNMNIPEGTRDIIFTHAKMLNKAAAGINKVYEELNYREIKTPAIEYYDVFAFDGQPISQEMMYKLTEKSGRLAVLRPDNTTPAARLAASKLRNETLPVKICYTQNVYRVNSDYSGKRNEYLQSGVEIIGGDGLKSDIFYIETALKVLQSLEMDYKLEIGHAAFYGSVIKNLNLPEETAEQIRVFIESKNIDGMAVSFESKIDDKTYGIISKIPRLFGGIEVIDEAKSLVGSNEEALAVLDYISMLYNIFCDAGYKDKIIVDLGIVHQLNYYTGCVISGYVEGVGENVLAGGRYDTLIKNFGFDVPATGFALNVDKIAEAKIKKYESSKDFKEKEEKMIDCMIFYSADAFAEVKRYISDHKQKEEKCEISCFDTLEKTIEYAKKQGIGKIVNITKNNIEIVKV